MGQRVEKGWKKCIDTITVVDEKRFTKSLLALTKDHSKPINSS